MRIVFLTLCVLLDGETLALARDSHGGEPIRIVTGFPVVTTFINGQGPLRMLIDTGATRCVVRPSVAARVGLVPERTFLLATMVDKKAVPGARALVRVGSREAPQTEVLINDLPSLDALQLPVDGLLGQSFLVSRPYLIDYSRKRLWLGDEAIARAQDLGSHTQIDLSSSRPVVPVEVNLESGPLHLILDSGVTSMVIRCMSRCMTLLDERTVNGVTNAGEIAGRQGRLPVAVIGSQKFFAVDAVLIGKPSDVNNADGSAPLRWFSAVYVDPGRSVMRFAR